MGCASATSVKHDGCQFDKVSWFPDACFHGAKEKIEKTHPIEDKGLQLDERLINRYLAGFWELPLNLSVQSGAMDAVEYLIRNGALFDKRNEDNQNVFHIAAIHERADIIEMIFISIERSADGNSLRAKEKGIDAVDSYFSTPLLYAITSGNLNVVTLLLKENANPKARIVESTVKQGDDKITKKRLIDPLETALFWKANQQERTKERLNHETKYRKRKEYDEIAELLEKIITDKPKKHAAFVLKDKGSSIQVDILSSSTSSASDDGYEMVGPYSKDNSPKGSTIFKRINSIAPQPAMLPINRLFEPGPSSTYVLGRSNSYSSRKVSEKTDVLGKSSSHTTSAVIKFGNNKSRSLKAQHNMIKGGSEERTESDDEEFKTST